MKKGEIGHEVLAFCNKCKVDTVHIITAVESDIISRVMCQLCFSYHKYKAPQSQEHEKEINVKRSETIKTKKAGGSATAKATKTAAKAAPKQPRRTRTKKTESWEDLIQTANENEAVNYTIDGAYNDGMVLNHKSFGLGVIKNILSEKKMEVVFQAGTKILVQNYSE
jgi:hypothetical protein